MFQWETLGPSIHVDVKTHPNSCYQHATDCNCSSIWFRSGTRWGIRLGGGGCAVRVSEQMVCVNRSTWMPEFRVSQQNVITLIDSVVVLMFWGGKYDSWLTNVFSKHDAAHSLSWSLLSESSLLPPPPPPPAAGHSNLVNHLESSRGTHCVLCPILLRAAQTEQKKGKLSRSFSVNS